jgi:hypothetical protein
MTKLEPGVVRIGHTRAGSSASDEVIVAEFDDQGVLVTWPRALGFVEAFQLNDVNRVPDPLILRDGSGWLTLAEGRSLGASASTLGHSEQRIQYARAVKAGAKGIDYAGVNGMTSEVDGLAKWTKRVPVTTKLGLDESHTRISSVSVIAENLDSLPLGGPLDLRLETSYTHNPKPRKGQFTISTALLVRTRTPDLVDWATHRQIHRMIQDLMCLVFGSACYSRLTSVMREDDQEQEPTDERRLWRDSYEPAFGRTNTENAGLADGDEPLFYMDEADPTRIATWLSEYSYWSRPTWIAMTALFDADLPAESQLLQVAVALEALGYAIAKRADPSAAVRDTYEQLIRRIFDALGYTPEAVVGQSGSVGEWCKAFNGAYKGVKHADNPLTDAFQAWTSAREGLRLIRCWLAAELGVPSQIVTKRFHEGRVGA